MFIVYKLLCVYFHIIVLVFTDNVEWKYLYESDNRENGEERYRQIV